MMVAVSFENMICQTRLMSDQRQAFRTTGLMEEITAFQNRYWNRILKVFPDEQDIRQNQRNQVL